MSQGGRAWLLAAAVVGLAAASGAALLARIDPATVRARAIAEVERATGRTLTVGALSLTLLPDLTIDADTVALLNPPGFAHAALLTARHVRARVALLPLLHQQVVVRELALTDPVLTLERRADGSGDWQMPPRARVQPPLGQASSTPAIHTQTSATVLGVTITDGTVAWNLPAGAGAVQLTQAGLREVNASSTISLHARIVLGGLPATLDGQFGGQTHLWHAADRSEWPLVLRLDSAVGAIAVTGTITDPRALAGYDLAIKAHGIDLGQLAGPWPWLAIPRLRDADLDTHVVDRADGIDIPRLSLTASASDLSPLIAGLHLEHLAIRAPNIDGTRGSQANAVSATGSYAGQPLLLDARLGPVGRLLGRGQTGARRPIELDARAEAGGARLLLRGRIAPGGDWAGTDATLHAAIPDLGLLSPLAGRALPRLHDLALDATVQSARGVLSVSGAHLVSPLADIAVDGTASLADRPRITGRLHIARLDVDALNAAWPHPAIAATVSAPVPVPPAWIIPDTALPFDRLRALDGEVDVQAATLRFRTVPITGLAVRLQLQQGRLDAAPFAAALAGVPVTGSLSIDAASAAGPLLALALHAPGLDAAALAALVGLAPGSLTGRIDLQAALAGTGATWHAIAGMLNGHAGVALTDGTIANALLQSGLAWVAPVAHLGMALPPGGHMAVSCLAAGVEVRDGVVVPTAFLLDTKRLRLAAAGAVDLGHETLALRLRPYLDLGVTGLVLPSRADGAWADPRIALEPAAGAASAASLALGLAGRTVSLGGLLDGLAPPMDAALDTADRGDCGPALAAARTVQAAPVAAASPAPVPQTRRERALALLHRLLHP